MTTIYCDDAGFTGDNLLDSCQPFFGYSAIALELDAAASLVQGFRRRFDIVRAENERATPLQEAGRTRGHHVASQ